MRACHIFNQSVLTEWEGFIFALVCMTIFKDNYCMAKKVGFKLLIMQHTLSLLLDKVTVHAKSQYYSCSCMREN